LGPGLAQTQLGLRRLRYLLGRQQPQEPATDRDHSLDRLSAYKNKPCHPPDTPLACCLPHGREHGETVSIAHSHPHSLRGDDVVCLSLQIGGADILEQTKA